MDAGCRVNAAGSDGIDAVAFTRLFVCDSTNLRKLVGKFFQSRFAVVQVFVFERDRLLVEYAFEIGVCDNSPNPNFNIRV